MTAESPAPRERRYRRILRHLPPGTPADRTEEMVAVLLAAQDDRRCSAVAETAALAGYVGRTWLRSATTRILSPDPAVNRRAAALLTVLLPLVMLFPVTRAATAVATLPWSFLMFNRDDLGVWALWAVAALTTVVGPAWLPRWPAYAATGWYGALMVLAAADGRTDFVMSGFVYLLIGVLASALLTTPGRLRAGRALLRPQLPWVVAALAGVFVLFALPYALGPVGPVSVPTALLNLTLLTAAGLALRSATGRALVTAGLPLFAAFVAGHGWWFGVGSFDVFYPFDNGPGAAEIFWLLALPALCWLAVRTLGGRWGRRDGRTT